MLLAIFALVAGCSNRPRNVTAAKGKISPAEAVSGISEAEAAALASTRAYLAAGGDANAIEDAYGNHYLHNAARSGYASVVKLLLEHGANIESRDSGGDTPLVVATRSISPQIVRILLDAGADVNAAGNFGSTAIHSAASNGSGDNTEILALLLRQGAKTDKQGLDGYTPLHWAARCGLMKKTQMLLNAGAPMEALDKQGDTPLHLAIMEQHFDVAKLLVARGAKLDLRSASGLGDLAYLRQNLRPANVNGKHEGWPGWTPLHYAAVGGQVKAVEFLLGQGADVDARGKSQDTPLYVAAENGHLEVARLLLDRGADVNAKDDSNRTPLHNAAWGCKPEVARLLIDRGAAIEARDEWGRTPLSDAAEHGYISVVKLLLDKGADANSTDQYGFAPLYWASLELEGAIVATPRGPSDFPETIRELKRHGARNPPDKQPPRSSK
jgi:ankyrin repeat protein